MHIANSDKPVAFYNLDVIISVGYRVKSTEGTRFRIWANKILKDYLVQGYLLNEKRLAQKEKGYIELEQAMNLVRKAITTGDISSGEALGLLDIITGYTTSWLLLQKYDEKSLPEIGQGRRLLYKLEADEAYRAIIELKKNLMIKHEATELFAHLREVDGLKGIFGNIYQTYDGNELYPTLESKAAHLLYFIIKDHPFTDGNKRSAAFIFILFLAKNKILFDEKHKRKINDRALVAITLLIAESNPKDKEVMIQVVMNLIV